ncbi:MAG: biopolymer transporter ExbD [Planctomycetota bacterium]
MRIRREEDSGAAVINISSLLDVMFILIIFFIATTTFKEEELDIEVSLPDSSAPRSLSSATKLVVINVRSAEGRKEGDPLYLVSNQPMTLEQLRDTVRVAVEENVNQKVLIRGDELAFHGEVAAAVSACSEAGVQEVNIGYDFRPLK